MRERKEDERERRERESRRLRKKRIENKEKKIILIIHPCYIVVLYAHTYCRENVKKFGFTHPEEGCFYEFGG